MSRNEYKIIPIFTNENKKYEDVLKKVIKNYFKINNIAEKDRFINKNNIKYNH